MMQIQIGCDDSFFFFFFFLYLYCSMPVPILGEDTERHYLAMLQRQWHITIAALPPELIGIMSNM